MHCGLSSSFTSYCCCCYYGHIQCLCFALYFYLFNCRLYIFFYFFLILRIMIWENENCSLTHSFAHGFVLIISFLISLINSNKNIPWDSLTVLISSFFFFLHICYLLSTISHDKLLLKSYLRDTTRGGGESWWWECSRKCDIILSCFFLFGYN